MQVTQWKDTFRKEALQWYLTDGASIVRLVVPRKDAIRLEGGQVKLAGWAPDVSALAN